MEEKYCFAVPQKACIKKENKFLIVKRSSAAKVFPNCWDFPGGKLEHGETAIEGLKREVREETTLSIFVGKPIFTFIQNPTGHFVLIIVYETQILQGEVTLSKEHSEYKWETKEEILKLQTEPFLREFLQSQI